MVFTLSFMIHFDLIFMEGKRSVSRLPPFFFNMWISCCSAPLGEKTDLSPLNCPCCFVKDRLAILVWSSSELSIPLHMSILLTMSNFLDYCRFTISFEFGACPSSGFIFLLQYYIDYSEFSCLPIQGSLPMFIK